MQPIRRSDFSRGANNRAPADRLPEGFVRDAVNFDPLRHGGVALRAGYTSVYAGTAVRGALALDHRILLADGEDLVEFDTLTHSSRVLRTIVGSGWFSGAVLNGELFLCTANECLRYDGRSVRAWGVPTPATPSVSVTAGGGLRAGAYKCTATFVDAAGEEGGGSAIGAFVCTEDGSQAAVTLPTPPPGGRVRLYASPGDTVTQYLQGEWTTAETVTLSNLRDSGAELGTQLAKPPVPGPYVAAHNGVLLVAVDNVVWVSHPLRPHLFHYNRLFFQFAAPVTMVQPAGNGVYVGADRTYWLTGVEGVEPTSVVVDDHPPVAGTGVAQGSDSAVWMTRHGPVLGRPGGAAEFLTRDHYVPTITTHGASGIVEHNGNMLAVTTLRGIPQGNSLAASDYVEAEVIYP